MYSKSYWIGCDDGKSDALMEQYNALVVPAIKASENHVGHHMLEAGPNKWLLVSNYHDKAAADKAVPMVRELVKPMMAENGMTLEIIAEGDVIHSY